MRKGMPNARVVVLGILPRGTGSGKGGPAEANSVDWPSHYAKATAALNKELGCALPHYGMAILCIRTPF